MKLLCSFLLASALLSNNFSWGQSNSATAKSSGDAQALKKLAERVKVLEERLRQQEDKEEIQALLLDYGRTLDNRDLVGYSNLFAKDGEWIGGFGTVKGRPALLDFMKKNVGERPNTAKNYHLLTNFIIEVRGDTATAMSRWSFVTPNGDKKPVLNESGRYEDTLIREDGKWKFLKRVVDNDLPTIEESQSKGKAK